MFQNTSFAFLLGIILTTRQRSKLGENQSNSFWLSNACQDIIDTNERFPLHKIFLCPI